MTGDVYKHITGSAQRRLSIERVGVKDGAFLATFGKGAIGRARSEHRSTFVSKLMHEHLATEARQEMWAGRTAGSVTCGCGYVLSWAAPDEVSRLQWHVLECGLPGGSAIRTRWHAAVRLTLSKWIKRRDVVDGVISCCSTTAGRIHTAAGDQSRGWVAPPMVEEADSGSWLQDPAASPPCFGSSTRDRGGGAGADSEDDEVESLDDPAETPDPPTRTTATITTARRQVEYHEDWDGVESAADPCLAAVKLLHVARRSVDTSRWWTMRWPQNAVSLVGRAGGLSPGKTYKLMRVLRKHALNYLDQLWMLASDRRHAKGVSAKVSELQADWRRVQKRLGKSRDKAGSLMPGWVVVQRRSHYAIVRQLERWTQLSLLRVSDQRRLPALHRGLLLPHPGPAEVQTRQTCHPSSGDASTDPQPDAAQCLCASRLHCTAHQSAE